MTGILLHIASLTRIFDRPMKRLSTCYWNSPVTFLGALPPVLLLMTVFELPPGPEELCSFMYMLALLERIGLRGSNVLTTRIIHSLSAAHCLVKDTGCPPLSSNLVTASYKASFLIRSAGQFTVFGIGFRTDLVITNSSLFRHFSRYS